MALFTVCQRGPYLLIAFHSPQTIAEFWKRAATNRAVWQSSSSLGDERVTDTQ
jgi:hypothetical protein